MKNKLLPIMVAIIVLPLLAHVDKAQLLDHLKMVRKEYVLERIAHQEVCKSGYAPFEVRYLQYRSRVVHEFYNKSQIMQKIVTDQIVRPEFDIICNNIIPLEEMCEKIKELPFHQKRYELMHSKGYHHGQEAIKITDKQRKKLLKLFVPIFRRLFLEFEKKFEITMFEKGFLEKRGISKGMKNWFDNIFCIIVYYPEVLENDYPLLKLIDAKIAELEAQA